MVTRFGGRAIEASIAGGSDSDLPRFMLARVEALIKEGSQDPVLSRQENIHDQHATT